MMWVNSKTDISLVSVASLADTALYWTKCILENNKNLLLFPLSKSNFSLISVSRQKAISSLIKRWKL